MEGSTDEVHGYHYSSYSNEHVEEDDVRHKLFFVFTDFNYLDPRKQNPCVPFCVDDVSLLYCFP